MGRGRELLEESLLTLLLVVTLMSFLTILLALTLATLTALAIAVVLGRRGNLRAPSGIALTVATVSAIVSMLSLAGVPQGVGSASVLGGPLRLYVSLAYLVPLPLAVVTCHEVLRYRRVGLEVLGLFLTALGPLTIILFNGHGPSLSACTANTSLDFLNPLLGICIALLYIPWSALVLGGYVALATALLLSLRESLRRRPS